MRLARNTIGILTTVAAVSALVSTFAGTACADRTPLVGTGVRIVGGSVSSVTSINQLIVSLDPSDVPCTQLASFNDVLGGDTPGTNYDGLIWSGGMQFAERFTGQTLSYGGDFDVVTGTPSFPLALQVGAPGQNLDVFAYLGNVLAGLGPVGYPDIDAIGEGSIAMYFPLPQSRVSFQLVGGNGGAATLSFYRADGSLIDVVDVSGLADLDYGFATADATPSIAGILVQNTDPSGIGVVNICHDGDVVNTHSMSWGNIKTLYR